MYWLVLYSVYVQLEVIFTQHIFKAYWAYPRDYVINKLQWIPKIWFRHHRSHILSRSFSLVLHIHICTLAADKILLKYATLMQKFVCVCEYYTGWLSETNQA
jgi:hypothetical protein